jgi:hypothetical protein
VLSPKDETKATIEKSKTPLTSVSETSDTGTYEEDSIEEETIVQTTDEYILRDPLLFGDFRNAQSGETRFYEDLLDYDAVYYLLQEVCFDMRFRFDCQMN